jgi:hypothetical protein
LFYRERRLMMPEDNELSAYHEVCAWSLSRRDGHFVHQFIVDCWALQHATVGSKPISIVFPLVSLYLHLEHGQSGRQAQLAHMQLAKHRKDWPRMTPPADEIRFSVREVFDLESDAAREQAIHRWCELTWKVWKDSQQVIRELVQRELNVKPVAVK